MSESVVITNGVSLQVISSGPRGPAGPALYDGPFSLSSEQKEQLFANLGFTAYADLTAANVAFATIGNIYYDRALGRLHINTA